MVDERATIEEIRSRDVDAREISAAASTGGLEVFGTGNPLDKIDLAHAEAFNTATFKEKGGKYKKEYELKKLFFKYFNKYKKKWYQMKTYPKQIKQKPAWFDLALGLFKENEISTLDKQHIIRVFNALWEYRDRILPERIMGEEEANRQYGTGSPYFEQPEEGLPSDQFSQELSAESMDVLPTAPQETYTPTTYPESPQPQYIQAPQDESYGMLGVRSFKPKDEEESSYLSQYIAPLGKRSVQLTPPMEKVATPTQGVQFTMGIPQSSKLRGGSGAGAFDIGRDILSGIRGPGGLKQAATAKSPELPTRPAETITVSPPAPMVQRKKKTSVPKLNRKVAPIQGLSKFRNIELPTIGKSKMPKIVKSTKSTLPKSKLKLKPFQMKKISTTLKLDKNSMTGASSDIKNSVNGIVSGVRNLHKGVRGEFRGGKDIQAINLRNIKNKKAKGNRDLNILNDLKSQTHSKLSRKAMECKMIPKLKTQCDKVFTKNAITGEVSKFREEFKDISKAVPTVKGERAKLTEVSMLGKSIDHGVDGAHVADVREMYRNSGTTRQMNIGMMDYDYSFVTGRRKNKQVLDYVEEDE